MTSKKFFYFLLSSLCLCLLGTTFSFASPPQEITPAEIVQQKAPETKDSSEGMYPYRNKKIQLKEGDPITLQLQFLNRRERLSALPTNHPDLFFVDASDPTLKKIAKSFGASLYFNKKAKTLKGKNPQATLTLQAEQKFFPQARSNDTTTELLKPPFLDDGKLMIPLNTLEEFLQCRITYRGTNVYIEPVIKEVLIRHKRGKKAEIKVVNSIPVDYKTFILSNPDRFVIDLKGAVLDTPSNSVLDPKLGQIRLGQFTLGPATSRIVIPIGEGGKSPEPGSGKELTPTFEIGIPDKVPEVVQTPRPQAPRKNVTKKPPHQAEQTSSTPPKKSDPVAPPSKEPQLTLTDLSIETSEEKVTIKLTADHPFSYRWQRINPPDNRLFIDIPKAYYPAKKMSKKLDHPFVEGIRLSQYSPGPDYSARLVFDLKGPHSLRYDSQKDPNTLVITIEKSLLSAQHPRKKGYGNTSKPRYLGTKVICLDAGHGGSDPGAVNHTLNLNEKTVALDITQRLATILEKKGWHVIMTRETDVDLTYPGSSAKEELGARSDIANQQGAEVFVSIHANASVSPQSNGTSTHYFKSRDYELARFVHPRMLEATERRDRGIIKNRFYVLAHSTMPAILLETAFLSNLEEGKLLGQPEYRQKIAERVAQGLEEYAQQYLTAPLGEKN